MNDFNCRSTLRHSSLVIALSCIASGALAQMPMPTTNTPTLHGGQPVEGLVVGADVGYPALRGKAYYGKGGNKDIGLEVMAPSYGHRLGGTFQKVGVDVRVPFRWRLLSKDKIAGSLRLAPLFHTGQNGTVGMGGTAGFIGDFALPKLFKIIAGLDTRWGYLHNRGGDYFAGSTLVNIGLEAFWKQKWFFTAIQQIGASYTSGGGSSHAVFQHMMGFGYKLK